MNFKAEIIRTSQKKLASNDNQYEIVFRTNNPMILDLGKLKSDSIFTVDVQLGDKGKDTTNDNNDLGNIE